MPTPARPGDDQIAALLELMATRLDGEDSLRETALRTAAALRRRDPTRASLNAEGLRREGEDRDLLADERDQFADERDERAERRDEQALERERQGWAADEAADAADLRIGELLATAKERESHDEEWQVVEDMLAAGRAYRQAARQDRFDTGQNRRDARRDRMHAQRDREFSAADRQGAQADRDQSVIDHQTEPALSATPDAEADGH